MNLVARVILLRVLHCFFTNLDSDDFGVWEVLLDGYADSADAAPQVKNDIALFDCLDDVGVEDFAHVEVDLEEGRRRNLKDMLKYLLLVEGGSIDDFGLFGWDAVRLPVVAQEAKAHQPNHRLLHILSQLHLDLL